MPRRPGTYEYEDEIPCRLCGRAFQAISWMHLRNKHHLTGSTPVEDYKRRFELSRACSRALTRKRLRSYIAFLQSSGKHWTKERVLAEIRARRAAGKPLNHGAVAHLAGMARKLFGSYDKALVSAKLDPWEIALQHRWTKPKMIEALRACATNGVWIPRVTTRRRCTALRAAAKSLFGSWPGALRAAKLRSRRAPNTDWTRDEVMRRIRRRVRLGLTLSQPEVARSEPALAAAARRIMGRPWSVLIQDLGYRGRKIVWTDEALCRELRHLRRFGRTSLPGVSQAAVHQAARKHFGSLAKAFQAAGLKPTRPPLEPWTPKRVLQRIRERARRGESLSWRDVLKSERGLYRAARRFFGKPWVALMREHGYDGGTTRLFWTDETVVKEAGRLRRGLPLSPGVTMHKLQTAAWHHFGSWTNAQAAQV